MHAISQLEGELPPWQSGAGQRLRFTMVLAAVILAGILSLVRLPPPGQFGPILELVVELNMPRPLAEPEPEVVPPPPLPQPLEQPVQEQTVAELATEAAPAEAAVEEGVANDWEVLREEAIKEVLDAVARELAYSVNPPFERARREASVRFRASLAPAGMEAWDNIEKDQLGRTILRLGDGTCFRVLDDPSAVNRWVFETFDQNIVYCDFFFGGAKGKELPWVDIIRERYPYLRDPVAIPRN